MLQLSDAMAELVDLEIHQKNSWPLEFMDFISTSQFLQYWRHFN